MKLLTNDEIRRELNALVARSEDDFLRRGIISLLGTRHHENATYQRRGIYAGKLARPWAKRMLTETLDLSDRIKGLEVFERFCDEYPKFREHDRPLGPRRFYQMLKDAGFDLTQSKGYVEITGVTWA